MGGKGECDGLWICDFMDLFIDKRSRVYQNFNVFIQFNLIFIIKNS